MKIEKFYLFLLACFVAIGAYSQDGQQKMTGDEKSQQQSDAKVKITGQVFDESGEGIPGANVTLKSNPTSGTVTDLDGKFILMASWIQVFRQRLAAHAQGIVARRGIDRTADVFQKPGNVRRGPRGSPLKQAFRHQIRHTRILFIFRRASGFEHQADMRQRQPVVFPDNNFQML